MPSLESEDVVAAEMKTPPKRKPGGVVKRDDAWQKHYERGELETLFAAAGLRREAHRTRALSVEHRRPARNQSARRKNRPWDWMCLAQRV